MFLTPQELETVSGYSRRSSQRRWLEAHGWKHEVDRFGKPQVLKAEMERKMLGKNQTRTRELNLAAIKTQAA